MTEDQRQEMHDMTQKTTTDRSWVGCISEAAERLDGEGWDTLADAVRALDASHDRAEAEAERVTAERDRLAATVQAFVETHGNAAYLADNVAAVRSERDEFEAERDKARAEVERLRAELDAIGDIAYRFSYHESPSAVEDLLVSIVSRAKRAAKGE